MNKKNILAFAIVGVLLAVIAIVSVIYIQDKKYIKQLPLLPDLSNATPELKAQIISSNKLAGNKVSAENIGKLGMVYYSANYYNEASQCFKLAIEKSPNTRDWLYYQGYLNLELGESAEALKYMKRVTEVNPNDWLAWYRMGEIYQQMDSTEIAEALLKKLLKLNEKETYIKNTLRSTYFPLQCYASILLSKIYVSANQPELAEKELLTLEKRYKTFGPVYRQLGMFYALQGNEELGEKYKVRANDLIVFNSPIDTLIDRLSLISKSEAYVLKQIDNAMNGSDASWTYELIHRALINIPNNKYIISKTIKQYLRMGLGQQALPLLEQHFLFFSDSYDELLQTGIHLADAGYQKEAARYLSQALTFKDKTPEQNATLAGLLFEMAGMKTEAIETMLAELEKNPKDVTLLGNAVFLFLQTEETEKARFYFDVLKRLSPGDANVKIFEGIMNEKTGNKLKAISLFEQAFDANQKNKYLIKHLSELYSENKLWARSLIFFKKALVAYPNDSELQMQLSLLLVTCPDKSVINLEEGKEYAERAFYNSRYTIKNRISAGRTLSIAFFKLGNKESAVFYINQTLEFAAKNNAPDIYMNDLRALSERFALE